MVIEVALGILLALAIFFIGLPVAIWLIERVLATVGRIFKALSYPRPRRGE
jgi:uncharacterized membrane protein